MVSLSVLGFRIVRGYLGLGYIKLRFVLLLFAGFNGILRVVF